MDDFFLHLPIALKLFKLSERNDKQISVDFYMSSKSISPTSTIFGIKVRNKSCFSP